MAETISIRGKVAIFFWEGYLGVAPSLMNAIRLLAEDGYEVDVIMWRDDNHYALPPHFPATVRLFRPARQVEGSTNSRHKEPKGALAQTRCYLGAARRLTRNVKRLIVSWEDEWFIREHLAFFAFAAKCTRKSRYVTYIGVDMEGLTTATLLAIPKKIPVVYWSLEIRFMNDFERPGPRLLKLLERWSHRRAALTVIQDWKRAECLADENGTDLARTLIVPNGPLGVPGNITSDYFRRKFHLPLSQRIILHMGMISPDACSLELAEAASHWPQEWALIFHERAKRDPADPYLQAVQLAGAGHVHLSLDPVTYDELDMVVSSGEIGLAIYNHSLGPNFTLMAGASGKLAHYLRCQLPVIGVNIPGLTEIMAQYRAGYNVDSLQNVSFAIEKIFSAYEDFRVNALNCYVAEYEFGARFTRVLEFIHALE